jgi:hypothetical protein
MTIGEARGYIGCEVALCWHDRKGDELHSVTQIYAADFIPLYGPCLITDSGEIRLDRVVSCEHVAQKKAA